MEDTPSKRRRLSPSEHDNESGADVAVSGTSPSKRGSWSSWLSPTKASLARFNPKLLPKPSSPPKSLTPRSPNRQRSLEPGALRSPTKTVGPIITPRLERAASASPRRSTDNLESGITSNRRRVSHSVDRSLEATPLVKRPESSREIVQESHSSPDAQLATELEATTVPRRFALSSRPLHAQRAEAEPVLPPTPEHLGLKPLPAQPQGLLSSSPTTQASRRKITSKSSPLKTRALAPRVSIERPGDANKENTLSKTYQQLPREVKDSVTTRKHEELRRLRDRLHLLQEDVTYLGQATSSLQETGSLRFVTEKKLRSLLTRKDPHYCEIVQRRQVNPLGEKLSQYLPFSRPNRQWSGAVVLAALEENSLSDSYRPIEAQQLAVDLHVEPRMKISTREEVIIESLTSGPLRTKRNVKIQEPSGLLTMDLELIVDQSNESATALQLVYISPWARTEFGSWAQHSLQQGDLPAIGRAFGEYWSLCLIRAKTLARCSVEFAHLLHDPNPSSSSYREDEDSSILRATTHAHLGQRSLQLSRDGASILIEWNIQLDWTGAANSVVGASCAVPASWRDADERGSFALIGPAFRRLVEERGVLDAVRVMIRTLLGPEDIR